MDANGSITAVIVDYAGSGYSAAPTVTIHNGTVGDPHRHRREWPPATSTLALQSVVLNTFGAGYTSAPTVVISDTGAGTGASATAAITTSGGSVTSITIDNAGSGYMTPGIKKFVDGLPGLCHPTGLPNYLVDPTAKYIPLAVPEAKKYNGVEADEYVIGLVQYRNYFSSSMPNGALVRGYVQLETPRMQPSASAIPTAERTDRRHIGRHRLLWRDTTPISRSHHRVRKEQGCAYRLPQPAAHRRGWRPVPAHRLHTDGRGHGPDGHG